MNWRRALTVALLLLLLGLQYRLWFGDGSLESIAELNREIGVLKQTNARLAERNQRLVFEIQSLKEGGEAIEERARSDFGLIREGELFYLIVEPEESSSK